MKTLKDVVIAVQHELDCSISELSRKLGKSRNYLNTMSSKELSAEKEQEIISSLLELVDDENRMLRNIIDDQEATITAYRDKVEIKNKTINHLHERLINTSKSCNQRTESQNATIVELNNTIATKDLFIDGQDKEIQDHKKSLEALAKAGHSTGDLLRKEKQKTRTLSLGIIAIAVVSTIALVLCHH